MALNNCLQSPRRPNILALVNHQPMKRSLIYSITVLLAAGLISSCTSKTESTTTTTPEKYPAKKDTYKKDTYKKKDAYKKDDKTTPKPYGSPTPKPYGSPTPKPSPTPKKYASPSPTPSPSPSPY